MSKSIRLAGLATLALTSAHASAQAPVPPSSVSIYGVVDASIEHVSNVGAAGVGLTRSPSITGSVPSRLGFRGTEDLGGGLRANFVLEQGFAPNNGVLGQGGRVFGRQAWVGVGGGWGNVTMGRQYTMLFWSILDSDVLGPNIYGTGSLDSYIPNARVDKSIAYRGTFSGLTVGASYSLGRDSVNAGPSPAGTNCAGEIAGDSSACREWSMMLKYDQPGWGVALVSDQMWGGPGAFAGLTSSALKDRRIMVNGYVKSGDLKLGAGVIARKNDGSTATPKSQLGFVGVTYSLNPSVILDAEYMRLKFSDSANKAAMFAVRGTYLLSKRTAIYATAGRIDNDGALALSVSSGAPGSGPAAGAGQNAVAMGVRHAF